MRALPMNKKAVAILAAGLIVASAGGAYAYWTTTGSGTGFATAASSNGTVTLHASFGNGIYPGGTKTVSFTADNAGASNLYVATIHLDHVSTDIPGCVVTDFTMPDVTSNTVVLAGASGATLTGSGTLSFANSVSNQDLCQGAVVTLHLSSL